MSKKTAEIVPGEVIKTEPEILHEGRYRLYRNPDGGLHLVYRPDGTDGEPQHMEVPGALIALMDQAASGKMNPMQFMRAAAQFMGGGSLFG